MNTIIFGCLHYFLVLSSPCKGELFVRFLIALDSLKNPKFKLKRPPQKDPPTWPRGPKELLSPLQEQEGKMPQAAQIFSFNK